MGGGATSVRYMASLVTVSTPDPSVLPEEARIFAELTGWGIISDFFLAHDRRRGWMVTNAGSAEEAREAVETLPLARYWEIEITGLLQARGRSDAVTTESRNKEVLTRFYSLFDGERFRRKDFGELDEILAPGFVDHDPLPQQGPGIEGLKDAFAFYYDAFSDFGIEVLDMVAEGDTVAVRFMTSGTFDGEFMGAAGNGKKFEALAFGLIRLDDEGRPTDRWGMADTAALMRQLELA